MPQRAIYSRVIDVLQATPVRRVGVGTVLLVLGIGAGDVAIFIALIRYCVGRHDDWSTSNLVILTLGVVSVALLYTGIRVLSPHRLYESRMAAGRCGMCNYDIRGLRQMRCPECGHEWYGAGTSTNLEVDTRME